MRLDDERESDNIEDRRGESSGGGSGFGGGGFALGGRHIGIGTIVIALVAMYFGVDPSVVLNNATSPTAYEAQQSEPTHAPPANDADARFVSKILADTEDTWKDIFAQSGKQYV